MQPIATKNLLIYWETILQFSWKHFFRILSEFLWHIKFGKNVIFLKCFSESHINFVYQLFDKTDFAKKWKILKA